MAEPPVFLCAACGATPRRRSFHALFHAGRLFPSHGEAKALCIAEERRNMMFLVRHYRITPAGLYGNHGKGTVEGIDIQDLKPFSDASFDLVTAIGVLDYVPDAPAAFASVARVLKPGGLFVLHILSHLLHDGDEPPVLAATKFSTDSWLAHYPRDVPISTFRYRRQWVMRVLTEAGLSTEMVTNDDPGGEQTFFLARRPPSPAASSRRRRASPRRGSR
ncbi:MAG: class I SAM-dependent methyltransferase [Proteobacteria bacterium]|nr:class I SAM-dependent methyltransferase [Pseudomonadota bacterium]